ncbi:MAG: hypothetical protein KBC00_03315 [Candidatus Levybacteria bacterium]|nr:hypothetical protein [Candidatus Levybacteria bacterium]MBP9814908.1 hypothetical protein [Candidatus Levybacteria bacterium]
MSSKEVHEGSMQPRPINPIMYSETKFEKYMDKLRTLMNPEEGEVDHFGSDEYYGMVKDGIIGVGVGIRISPGGSSHVFYRVEPDGRLSRVLGVGAVTAEEAFDLELFPGEPWSIESPFLQGDFGELIDS